MWTQCLRFWDHIANTWDQFFWGKFFRQILTMTLSTSLANHLKINFSANRLCKYEGEGDLVNYTQDVYRY